MAGPGDFNVTPINEINFTQGAFFLFYNNAQIGQFVENYKSEYKLATEVKVRHNFWANQVFMDGRYPALSHNHSITCYFESTNRINFAYGWHKILTTLYTDIPVCLQIRAGNFYNLNPIGTAAGSPFSATGCNQPNLSPVSCNNLTGAVLIDFGNCYFTGPTLKEPEALLMYRAGIIELNFLGNVIPRVCPGGVQNSFQCLSVPSSP